MQRPKKEKFTRGKASPCAGAQDALCLFRRIPSRTRKAFKLARDPEGAQRETFAPDTQHYTLFQRKEQRTRAGAEHFMATVIEGVMIAVVRILLTMLRIVVAECAVMLQEVHEHLRYTHPLVHIRGTEAIEH